MQKKTLAKLLLIAAACSAAPSIVRAQESSVSSDIPQLTQILTDGNTTQYQKDQAAEKLASRSSKEANQALQDALAKYSVPAAQGAAAKALSTYPSNEPNLINPLFALLGGSGLKQSTVDSAAMALTAYKSDPTVLSRLMTIARENSDEKVRIAAIRAMGTFVEKRSAEALSELIKPGKYSPNINLAAQHAIAYMTGQRADLVDNDQLVAWWEGMKNASELNFVTEIYKTRSLRYDQVQRQLDSLKRDVGEELNRQYASAGTNQDQLLLKYLQSEQYLFRAIGAQIAQQTAKDNGAVSPLVREEIKKLISDSSPAVREEAANAIAAINDASSIDLILTQLDQETDSNVRTALAKALGPIQDIRAVRPLMKLLDDPHLSTIQAAATSLSDTGLGTMIHDKDPRLADDLAERLVKVLQKYNSPLNDVDLRKTVVKALIPLASKAVGKELQKLLENPAEHTVTKRYLIEAIGMLNDQNYEDTIASCIDDPDVDVKVAAIKVYGKIARRFAQVEKKLSGLIDPQSKEPQEVRDAAWETMKNLFQYATNDELDTWQNRFEGDVRRLAVLQIISTRNRNADDKINETTTQQRIGDTAFGLGPSDPQYYLMAISAYQKAMVGAEEQKNMSSINTISESLTDAFLKAKKYPEAIKFIQQQSSVNPELQSLGVKLRQEADALMNVSHQYDDALKLIDLSLKMNPPLKEKEVVLLKQMQEKVITLQRQHNSRPGVFDFPISAQLF